MQLLLLLDVWRWVVDLLLWWKHHHGHLITTYHEVLMLGHWILALHNELLRRRRSDKLLLLLSIKVWRHHSTNLRSMLVLPWHLRWMNWSLLLHHHSLLHHVLLMLILLNHHYFLRMLAECHLLLFIDELKELFSCHWEDLIKSSKHETLKVFIWNTQDRRTVGLNLLMELISTIENKFMLLLCLLLLPLKSWLETLWRRFLNSLLPLHILGNSCSLRI